MANRNVRILSVHPVHAGGRRQRGERSHMEVIIDLGLKTGETAKVIYDERDAVALAGVVAMTASQVAQANKSYEDFERMDEEDEANRRA